MTSDLEKRIYEHQNKLLEKSFSAKYNLFKLLYWEVSEDINATIKREKQLKKWNRDWKLNLIKRLNPELVDLSEYEGFSVEFGLKKSSPPITKFILLSSKFVILSLTGDPLLANDAIQIYFR
jgi:putative endonuclease